MRHQATSSKSQYYTYAHFRADDGKCLYIGKGKGKRAWVTSKRSAWWKSVVAKHGYRVQILATWESEEEAFEHEKFLIACFRDMGHPLVNLTGGGEGPSGLKHSAETRAKMAERARQQWSSPEARAAQAERARQQMSGKSNPSAKLSDETCRQIFRLRDQGLSQRKIAAQIGCGQPQVSHILSGKKRRNIYLEFHPDHQSID